MPENEVPLNITADTKSAQDSIADFTKALTKAIETIQKSSDATDKSVKKTETQAKESGESLLGFLGRFKGFIAAAAGVFAARELIQGIESAIDAAAEADQAVAQLNVALASTGEYSDESSQAIQDWASEVQKSTTVSDDAAVAAVALAKSFGITNEQAKELTNAAIQLSAATGQDLNTSVQQLGATFSGSAGRLAKLGPEFKALTEAQLKNGDAIKLIQSRYNGFAEELTRTFSGAISQAKNNYGDIFEAAGKIITQNPVVIATINELSKSFVAVSAFIDENRESISAFVSESLQSLVSILPNVIDGFSLLIEVVFQFGKYLALAVSTVNTASAEILRFGDFLIENLSEPLDKVVGALQDFLASMVKMASFIPGVKSAFSAFGVDVDGLADNLQKAADKNLYFGETTKDVFKGTADTLDGVNDAIFTGLDIAETGVAGIRAGLGKFKDAAAGAVESIGKISNAAANVKPINLKVEVDGAASEFGKAFEKEEKKVIEEANKSFNEMQTGINKMLSDLPKRIAETASQHPVDFIVGNLTIQSLDLSQAQTGIAAASVGILDKVLQGAAGAKSLISEGVGAFANALIPGIGPAVSSIVSKLAEGPDAVKKFVREFVDAVPDIVTKIAEAMPAVVEALVDSLINEGGIVKIAVALAKAFSGQSFYKSIGAQIGKGVADAIPGGFGRVREEIATFFRDGAQNFINGLGIAFQNIGDAFSEMFEVLLPNALENSFSGFISDLGNAFSGFFAGIGESLSQFGATFAQSIPDLLSRFSNGLADALANGGTSLANAIKQPLSAFKFPSLPSFAWPALPRFSWPALPSFAWPTFPSFRFPEIPRPTFVDDLINFFSNFSIDIPGVGKAKGLFAEGGVVPGGFPNDTYPAGLTSGELVVPQNLTSKLDAFLAKTQSSSGVDLTSDQQGITNGLLAKVLDALRQPMTVTTSAELNGRTLADIILQLNRSNARLA